MIKSRMSHTIHYDEAEEVALIVGGKNEDEVVAECEAYDPLS